MVNMIKSGFNAVKFVDGTTKVLTKTSTGINNVATKGVFNTMFEGLGKVLGFGGRVLGESKTAAQTLLKQDPSNTVSINKIAALAAIGVGIGATAKAGADALKHTRTDYLIENRSGAYTTDKATNITLRNVSLATAGLGAVLGLQGAATLAGESVLGANSASAGGSVLKSIGSGSSKIINGITSFTTAVGDAIKPGLGKITGAPLTLLLGGLAAHLYIDQRYLLTQDSSLAI